LLPWGRKNRVVLKEHVDTEEVDELMIKSDTERIILLNHHRIGEALLEKHLPVAASHQCEAVSPAVVGVMGR
jgi:hypothetical protein